jgi:hypothetical protein
VGVDRSRGVRGKGRGVESSLTVMIVDELLTRILWSGWAWGLEWEELWGKAGEERGEMVWRGGRTLGVLIY